MVAPAMMLGYLLKISFFCFLIFLLTYTIWKLINHSYKKAVFTGILFIIFFSFTILLTYSAYKNKQNISKSFLGYYTLNHLDGEVCENCKIKLNVDYTYDIIVEGKIVGNGKWNIGTAIDIPGWFLEIENGPCYVIWERDRLIEYIDRIQK